MSLEINDIIIGIEVKIQVNRYGYPYFHRNFAEYGRLRSEIARKRTVFVRNIGHSNTAPYTRSYFHCIWPYTRSYFHCIRPYTCRNLIIIGSYFCARYYNRIQTVSFDLSDQKHLRVHLP